MKIQWLVIIVSAVVVIIIGCDLLIPGNRYILLHYNSANEYGRFYYSNGLWTRPILLNGAESGLSDADLSPDGSRLAFVHNGLLYTYTLLSGDINPLKSSAFNSYYTHRIQWSPDGKQIGFICSLKFNSAEICIFDIARQQLHILTRYLDQPNYQVPYFGSWGPDNNTIVYTLETNPDANGGKITSLKIIHTRELVIDSILDGNLANLQINRDPVLGPDGKTILFSAMDTLPGSGGNAIYQINAAGSGLRRVISFEGVSLGNPVWSPDGRSFYAGSNVSGHYKPLRYNLKGQLLPGLVFQNQRYLLAWRFSAIISLRSFFP